MALKNVWVCTYISLTILVYEGRGAQAYEFLEGGVYWCDSQSVNKKVRCIKKLKSERAVQPGPIKNAKINITIMNKGSKSMK